MNNSRQQEDALQADQYSLDDIESAYLRAMEATESVEGLFPDLVGDRIVVEEEDPLPAIESSHAVVVDSVSKLTERITSPDQFDVRVTPSQVIEALLFVGGEALPGKKIMDVLGGTTTHEAVDLIIENLNIKYLEDSRPYQIRLIEGGYQMVLKPEFESVRRRVYGQGPKEVKLNQESLEVLALVAYQQPITRDRVDEIGKKNASRHLRQLLRRQLITLDRSNESGEESYRTTKRFLDLFGLSSLADLPQTSDFNFK